MRKPPRRSLQEKLPGIRSYEKEQENARERQIEKTMSLWKAGLSGDKLFTAVMLIICGLPISEEPSKDPVIRKAQLGDKSWVRVTFSRGNDNIALPYGADRTMVYFLTNKAVLQQSRLLHWEYANEYMHLFGMDSRSGKNYKAVQARFVRVAYMNIMVEYLDKEGQVTEHWKSPLIDYARIAAEFDGEGNWKPSTTISKMLAANQKVTFGSVLFDELKKNPVPIPIELILAAGKRYRVMDYMIFLCWRAFAGHSESFIPWRYLQDQFDNRDANPGRWPEYFKAAYRTMKMLPDPINQIRADINSAGISIHPFPVGTAIFEGQPKLGYRQRKIGSGN
jgi:hypothetical protein